MKIRLTTLELCVSSFLYGIRTDLWPFYGFYSNRFDLSTIPEQSLFPPYKSLYFHSTMSMLIFRVLVTYAGTGAEEFLTRIAGGFVGSGAEKFRKRKSRKKNEGLN